MVADNANGGTEGPHGAATAVSQMLAQLIPQLYRGLDALPADDFSKAAAVVSGAAVVWVGNGFAQTDRVALRCVNATLQLCIVMLMTCTILAWCNPCNW